MQVSAAENLVMKWQKCFNHNMLKFERNLPADHICDGVYWMETLRIGIRYDLFDLSVVVLHALDWRTVCRLLQCQRIIKNTRSIGYCGRVAVHYQLNTPAHHISYRKLTFIMMPTWSSLTVTTSNHKVGTTTTPDFQCHYTTAQWVNREYI